MVSTQTLLKFTMDLWQTFLQQAGMTNLVVSCPNLLSLVSDFISKTSNMGCPSDVLIPDPIHPHHDLNYIQGIKTFNPRMHCINPVSVSRRKRSFTV